MYVSAVAGSAAQEGAVRQASVMSEQFAKILEISKKEYNRYIKPFHKEEQVLELPLARAHCLLFWSSDI